MIPVPSPSCVCVCTMQQVSEDWIKTKKEPRIQIRKEIQASVEGV